MSGDGGLFVVLLLKWMSKKTILGFGFSRFGGYLDAGGCLCRVWGAQFWIVLGVTSLALLGQYIQVSRYCVSPHILTEYYVPHVR